MQAPLAGERREEDSNLLPNSLDQFLDEGSSHWASVQIMSHICFLDTAH